MTARILAFLTLLLALGLALLVGVNVGNAAAGNETASRVIQALPVVDDFEAGLPAGWFQYGDYGSGTAIATNVVADSTVPGLPAGNQALEINYTSAGWGAGTGRNLGGEDWSSYDGVAFWFKGLNSDATFRVILSDNLNPAVPGDSAERFAFEFVDDRAGWRHVNIPWGAFFRDYAYQPPGAPDDGLTLTEMQAYAIALPVGTAGAVYLDDVRLVKYEVVDDFESGLPAGWFQYGDYGSGTAINTTLIPDATVPGQPADNDVLEIAYTSAGWGAGTGRDLGGADWSDASGFSFWFLGGNSGATYRVILSDNLNPAVPGDSAERFAYEFADNFSGWRLLSIPWASFSRDYAYQPPGAPDDGLTLTAMQAYAFALPTGTRTTRIDQVALFGDGVVETKVNFESSSYRVIEGGVAAITVTLNAPAAVPVTVTYATADDTAVAGVDYVATTGQVVFAPGETTATFTVQTLDNTADDGDRALLLSLSDPLNAALGARRSATLTIADDELTTLAGKSVIIDDFEDGQLPTGTDANGLRVGFVTWNAVGASVAISTTDAPPAPVPGLGEPNIVLQEDLTIGPGRWAGFTHAFSNDTLDEWVPQDWSTYEGVCFWLYGNNTGGTLFLDILENRNPGSTRDDAERWSVDIPDNFSGWQYFEFPWSAFHRKDIGNGAPNDGFMREEVHGYGIGGYGNVDMGSHSYFVDQVAIFGNTGSRPRPLTVQFARSNYQVTEGATAAITVTLNMTSTEPVSITYTTAEGYATPDRNYVPTNGLLVIPAGQLEQTFQVVTLQDNKAQGDQKLMLNLHDPVNAEAGFQVQAMLTIVDDDEPDPALLDDFEGFHRFGDVSGVDLTITEIVAGEPLELPGQGTFEQALTGVYGPSGGSFTRTFPASQDWSSYNGLRFWYYGRSSGQRIKLYVLNNQAATTDRVPPGQWELVWSDEFDGPAGAAPNPNVWSAEIGDGTLNGIPGWGNSESQFYTNSPHNAATDGHGNLVITLDQADPAQRQLCWYGPCHYTSARLISANKVEAQYGRIEARIRVPDSAAGLWPAFWMLGTNIGEVGWPQSGEIDIMEYVSRNPYEVFGTIHGPGYSGGAAFGRIYTLPQPVAEDYHTFAVEWSPDLIRWFVDGVNYHTATPADVAPNEWVFNHPFYVLLNLAIGGNFGGAISPDLTFPQQILVDYVRVYQARNTSERFEASFVDNFSGWRRVSVPFSAFTRSAQQPPGAPNDGFGLDEIWGYGIALPSGSSGVFHLDQVQVGRVPIIQRTRRFNIDRDTFIHGAQPNVAFGGAQTMWVGFFDQMRPVVHAPITGIPADAEIDAAYLYLYVVEGRGFTRWSDSVISNVSAHAVTTPWTSETATWLTPWNAPGGDYGPAVGATHIGSGRINTWLRLDVSDAVRQVVRSGVNHGIMLTSDNNRGVRYGMAASEYFDPSKRGYIRVYFRTVD